MRNQTANKAHALAAWAALCLHIEARWPGASETSVSPRPAMKTFGVVTCLIILASSGCTSNEAASLVPDEAKLEICPVHNVRTKSERVMIHYGLPMIPVRYAEAEKVSFPNAWLDVKGGCMPLPSTKAKVRYCSKCREEKGKWMNVHARSAG